MNKGDLKGFQNLKFLKLPNSIKNIDQDVFDNTPCLNYENISDHPIIRRIKKAKFKEYNDLEQKQKKKKFNLNTLLKILPSIDTPNYNFENNNENDKEEKSINIKQEKEDNNNNYKYNNFINDNNINENKKIEEKTERTVDDIVQYDKTNGKYAPFITKIIKAIKNGKIKFYNGDDILEELCYKLAKICIKIKKKNNFTPRPVQILAILRLADSIFNNDKKGSIGEIKTGEGKSFIVSTLAILLCQYNKKIDIITSNIELASRDQKEQDKNFKLFNISSGILYREEEKDYLRENESYKLRIERGYDLEVFKNQIVYSTNANFEFVYLNSMFVDEPLRPYERKYDVVIVDEVDNMFIDQGTSPAMISKSCDVIQYENILNVIYYNRDKDFQSLKDCLEGIFSKCAFFNEPLGLKKIKDLKEAALASDRKIRDIDYIIDKVDGDYNVIIIDSHTGIKKPKSKWSNSIHEMVQIKEGIKPDTNSVTYTAVTQHDFFNLYSKIVGVTGTVGTDKDRKDLKSIYNVEIFKCPRHYIREKKIIKSERPEGLDNVFELINDDINKQIKKGRPVLVIMDCIKNVDDFVSQTNIQNISKIKGIDPIEDENSRNIAGQEKKVTIATSAAGRGVDIKLSKIALKNGGLHVIIPFLMPNQRALEQAAGRCGRQGQPGSVNIYISEEDYYLASKAFDIKEHNLWIIQNKFVEYLHQNHEFLFKGTGSYKIPNLEIPFCTQISNVFKICAFHVANTASFFNFEDKTRKHYKALNFLMDMITITWGLFFNELTNDDECEKLEYCENKLKEYLNCLVEYLPKNINDLDEETNYLKKKLLPYNKLKALAIGAVILVAAGFSAFYFPQALPSLVFGTIEIKEDLLDALKNNEEINWKRVFTRFTHGCVDGIAIRFGLKGKALCDLVISPIFEKIEAEIDGKEYDIPKETFNKLINIASGNIASKMMKYLDHPCKDIFKKICDKGIFKGMSCDNRNIQKVAGYFYKNKNLVEGIHKIANFYSENLMKNMISNKISKDMFLQYDSFCGFMNHLTKRHLLSPSNIEKDIFPELDDSIIKTNINLRNHLLKELFGKINNFRKKK